MHCARHPRQIPRTPETAFRQFQSGTPCRVRRNRTQRLHTTSVQISPPGLPVLTCGASIRAESLHMPKHLKMRMGSFTMLTHPERRTDNLGACTHWRTLLPEAGRDGQRHRGCRLRKRRRFLRRRSMRDILGRASLWLASPSPLFGAWLSEVGFTHLAPRECWSNGWCHLVADMSGQRLESLWLRPL